jgi:hypothetical protein
MARRTRSTRTTRAASAKRIAMVAVRAWGSRIAPLMASPEADSGTAIRITAASPITKLAARGTQISAGVTPTP